MYRKNFFSDKISVSDLFKNSKLNNFTCIKKKTFFFLLDIY